jgi:tRNA A-37 threonylcarbamoyl transferase component Bud32
MKFQHTTEVNAYKQMECLQGKSVPTFFGQYQYFKENSICVDLILLEHITAPSFASLHGLLPDEIQSLQNQCMVVLGQIHSCGVVHNDIAARNMFWAEKRLIVCDFAWAIMFNDSIQGGDRERVLRCKQRDLTFMKSVVKDTEAKN